jgi:hypothetical protein
LTQAKEEGEEMTESEWLACEDPWPMLEFLRGRASERKLRLFTCACWRRRYTRSAPAVLRWTLFRLLRRPLERTERAADGRAEPMRPTWWRSYTFAAANAEAAATATVSTFQAVWPRLFGWPAESKALCTALRDIFGNPFRPPSLPENSWLTWNGGAVPKIAQAIYDDRRFDDLPVLADALEDAGCTDPEILGHLRGEGVHVRGCWVVDLVLGRA